MNKKPTLYLVPTSISSPSETALNVKHHQMIKGVQNVAVESEKIARQHLVALGLDTPIQQMNYFRVDEHSKKADIKEITDYMKKGHSMIMISDAGIPAVADPGKVLIREAHKNNIAVKPLIPQTSLLAALAASGLNGQSFAFNGYLPVIQDHRESKIKELEQRSKDLQQSQIFMETPYRSHHLFQSLLQVLEDKCELSLSMNLCGEKEFIKTALIGDWKRMRWPNLNKQQCIFIIDRTID